MLEFNFLLQCIWWYLLQEALCGGCGVFTMYTRQCFGGCGGSPIWYIDFYIMDCSMSWHMNFVTITCVRDYLVNGEEQIRKVWHEEFQEVGHDTKLHLRLCGHFSRCHEFIFSSIRCCLQLYPAKCKYCCFVLSVQSRRDSVKSKFCTKLVYIYWRSKLD